MTNRERMNATLRCEPTDRPPVIEWLGLVAWAQTLERWKEESGIADLKLADYFEYDHGFKGVPAELGPWPRFEYEVLEETDEEITYRDWRGIVLRNRKDGNTLPNYVSNPVTDRNDWERYKAERLQSTIESRIASVPQWIEETKAVDAPVQIGNFPFGCFGMPRDVLGVENLLVTYYDDPELIRDIIDTHADIWISVYSQTAKLIQIDHIHMWEDMSGKQGSLISMDMVDEFMMPTYERIAGFAATHGVSGFSVDTDGYVPELVEIMYANGVNSFFPFEVQAGNDIFETRRTYADMSIWGGLDKRALAKDHDAIHRELDRAQEMFALGGYIVGFDHAIPPDVPWKNFKYFVDELNRIVK